MTFCYAPWTNIDINPMGGITPCCKFQHEKYHSADQYKIQTHTLEEYANSTFLADIKQEFKNGQWPVGCTRCKTEEQNSIPSKRNLDFERWESNYKAVDLEKSSVITASIAFGNTCNLKCISCNSYSSSRWQKEYKTIYGIDVAHVKFYKQGFVQDFVAQTPNIVHLDIPGGEPFLSGVTEQQELLQHYINTGAANNITLHYTTNCTTFPDPAWWELWKHFKEIDLQLSIDGVGARYEYMRFPSEWSILVANTQRYLEQQSTLNNFRLSVSHTVSAYNIYYLDEFFSWCYTIGLPRPWLGRVHNPTHMRPSVWSPLATAAIVEHLQTSKHEDVVAWSSLMKNSNDSELFDTFKTYLHQHDKYRNTNFANTFPELAQYI
jgi:hypothetical protein